MLVPNASIPSLFNLHCSWLAFAGGVGGGAGPASVFDMASGATSSGEKFVDVFASIQRLLKEADREQDAASGAANAKEGLQQQQEMALEKQREALMFSHADVQVYQAVVERFMARAKATFGLTKAYVTRYVLIWSAFFFFFFSRGWL